MDTIHRVGAFVTWGTGAVRAQVASEPALRVLPGESSPVPVVSCVLLRDHASPCGRVFKKGTAVPVPLDELRPIQ
jgi:hypothetical protein